MTSASMVRLGADSSLTGKVTDGVADGVASTATRSRASLCQSTGTDGRRISGARKKVSVIAGFSLGLDIEAGAPPASFGAVPAPIPPGNPVIRLNGAAACRSSVSVGLDQAKPDPDVPKKLCAIMVSLGGVGASSAGARGDTAAARSPPISMRTMQVERFRISPFSRGCAFPRPSGVLD